MSERSWDIIGRRKWGYAFSMLVIIPGIVALILNTTAGRGALDWGIDFTGGNLLQVRIDRPFTVGEIRQIVDQVAVGQSVIQRSDQEVFIRTRPLPTGKKQQLVRDLQQQFGTLTVLRQDEVGPRIGQELRNIAIVAVILGLFLQLIYIAVRFKSMRFAVAADVALLHDLLVVIGIFAITRKEVNSSFVAVLLTVVGYSINDTVVLFDRVRENLAQRTRESFGHLVNRSILEALVRSINTGLTTILAILAVYVFGGSTIRDFAFGLMVGILTGGYSSILIACPILVDWHLWSERRERGGRETPKAVEPAREPAAVSNPRPAMPRPGGARPGRRRNRR